MKCECCDHPLEHAIAYAIARYEAPIPPPTLKTLVHGLRQALEDWKAEQ